MPKVRCIRLICQGSELTQLEKRVSLLPYLAVDSFPCPKIASIAGSELTQLEKRVSLLPCLVVDRPKDSYSLSIVLMYERLQCVEF